MNKFLTLQYYFTLRPDPNFQLTKLVVVLIILLFISSIALQIYRKKYVKDKIVKKILKRYPSRLNAFGVVLLLLLLSREAGIPFLSMRIWWFLLLLLMIYWLSKTIFNFKKEYSKRLFRQKQNQFKNKYIPKKKH